MVALRSLTCKGENRNLNSWHSEVIIDQLTEYRQNTESSDRVSPAVIPQGNTGFPPVRRLGGVNEINCDVASLAGKSIQIAAETFLPSSFQLLSINSNLHQCSWIQGTGGKKRCCDAFGCLVHLDLCFHIIRLRTKKKNKKR